MHRDVEDVLAIFEQRLRAVAVVDVEVEDEQARHPGLLEHPLRHAGDGIEEAEAHRFDALGVMPGRAGDDERAIAAEHARRGGQRRAHRRARRCEAL